MKIVERWWEDKRFFAVEFTEDEVLRAKEKQAEKDAMNLHGGEFEKNQYIGMLGEDAFWLWLETRALADRSENLTAWSRHQTREEQRAGMTAEIDFSVAHPFKVGVKTGYRNHGGMLARFHVCVNARQFRKESDENVYVFVSYYEPERTAVIAGWIPKEEFATKCELKRKGEAIDERGLYEAMSDMLRIKIGYLCPMNAFEGVAR